MLKRSEKVFEYELPIKIIPQKEGGFVVTCPVWKDCFAQGESVDEAVLEITAVAQSLIELYKEEGLQIPLKLQSTKRVDNSHLSVPILTTA
ncbi:MAG: type II toxin-antitoxin system HicB family antitoxin [bacterium]|nr:type II toxin-antitoxin system HicB family antitoxin [bacterium]